jgi:hypothetical protein
MRCTIVALALAFGLAGCAAPLPIEPDPMPPEQRAERRQDGAVSVHAAALGAAESQARFGVSLHGAGVQPVWLRIENNDPVHYWLLPVAIDRDYFLPSEVAHRIAGRHAPEALVERLSDAAIPNFVPAGGVVSGMIYSRAEEGVKPLSVQLIGLGRRREFPFALLVPGLRRPPIASSERIYAGQRLTDLDDAGLLAYAASLPCCATGPEGQPGDPLNFMLIGQISAQRLALASRGWALAEVASAASSRRMAAAFLFGNRSPYGPVSDLHVFGRAQDVALQKARETVAERLHLRLWLAPVTWRGQPVAVGQISRDIGVKLSGRLWPPTTHEIDPHMDEARFYLLQDLLASERVERLGHVSGVGAAPRHAPRRNAENDPYFTDGLRLILQLTEVRTDVTAVRIIGDPFPVPTTRPSPMARRSGDLSAGALRQ